MGAVGNRVRAVFQGLLDLRIVNPRRLGTLANTSQDAATSPAARCRRRPPACRRRAVQRVRPARWRPGSVHRLDAGWVGVAPPSSATPGLTPDWGETRDLVRVHRAALKGLIARGIAQSIARVPPNF